MNKKASILIMTLAITLFAASSFANVYSYVPTPNDIWGLDHDYYYTWGFEWNHPEERIANVVITFTDIYDWRVEPGDSLHVNLLDNPEIGTFANYEGYTVGNYFEGMGDYVGVWSDPFGGIPNNNNVSFELYNSGLMDNFRQYAADGTVGFGFDPDCHYYNSGVQVDIYTAVPEPATMALFGLGLFGMGVARKKFRK